MTINNPYIFYAAAAAVFAYILYTMIRRRRGLRPGSLESDTEL